MKAIILKGNLKAALDAVSRMVGDGHPLPILKNILIRAEGGDLKVCSTNLEAAIIKSVPGKIIEEGSVTIPFSVLNSIVNNIQSEKLEIESKKSGISIRADNYEASIQGMSADDYPIIPHVDENGGCLEISGSILKSAIGSVVSAAQISELRPEISGILFDLSDGGLKLVATDSFRLAEKTLPESSYSGSLTVSRFIVPLKPVQEALKIINDKDPVHIYCNSSQILFRSSGSELISRIIGGKFPDYQSIIPRSATTEVSIDKEELLSALKLASVFSAKNSEIRLRISKDKGIEVYSADSSVGENHYLIPASVSGEDVDTAFNWRFLSDGIKNCTSSSVSFSLQGDIKPAIIRSVDDNTYFYIIMPIKSS